MCPVADETGGALGQAGWSCGADVLSRLSSGSTIGRERVRCLV